MTSWLKLTSLLTKRDGVLRFDEVALQQRLSTHHAQGQGGAVISTPDFLIEGVQTADTRSIKTNMACFGMSFADNKISLAAPCQITGETYFELVRALISTRTVPELLEWLKAAPEQGPQLDMVLTKRGGSRRV
jgi:hypothetical protein